MWFFDCCFCITDEKISTEADIYDDNYDDINYQLNLTRQNSILKFNKLSDNYLNKINNKIN